MLEGWPGDVDDAGDGCEKAKVEDESGREGDREEDSDQRGE